jgi:hypothetical protein
MDNDTNAMAREWPDPTPEMLASPEFEAVWQCIKKWDINVPDAYVGYCGATGNHVRAILDALRAIPVRALPYPTKEAVGQAVKDGNLEYWRASQRQEAAFKDWKECGFAGECPQCQDGSLVDYITRAVVALSPPLVLSPPTPDQEAYLREIQDKTGKYDPTVVLGAPRTQDTDQPTYAMAPEVKP